MEQLLRHGGLSICGKTVAVEALAPRLTHVACLSRPGYVADEHLLGAMAPYGKVVAVVGPATVDRPTVRNCHRIVQIEMKPEKPVPNFTRVLEHRVICDYPGVLRVCSRCKKKQAITGKTAKKISTTSARPSATQQQALRQNAGVAEATTPRLSASSHEASLKFSPVASDGSESSLWKKMAGTTEARPLQAPCQQRNLRHHLITRLTRTNPKRKRPPLLYT
ncbi:hypothetical protein HPB48_026649 [Haemaphysalis longicornis]|uniref:Uncharacterized protein n=1 Tax=Haemaphysalis longicornis TaxID=44386 RepID=A0A9J6H1P2_HAELO|nr:hypothetical protein HPB48_026649 [Haemaphysalis longicornis]